jgi:tryptophan-rich sensory protein
MFDSSREPSVERTHEGFGELSRDVSRDMSHDMSGDLSRDVRAQSKASPDPRGGQVASLVALATLTAAAAMAGSMAAGDSPSFYAQLDKPSFAPPAAVFGPVWTTLYVLMTIAAWLGVRERGWRNSQGLVGLYVAQLVANMLWSILFFGRRLGAAALLDVLLLWALVGALCSVLYGIRRLAAALMAPYLLWVTFAAILTFSVWRRNPGLL